MSSLHIFGMTVKVMNPRKKRKACIEQVFTGVYRCKLADFLFSRDVLLNCNRLINLVKIHLIYPFKKLTPKEKTTMMWVTTIVFTAKRNALGLS